MNAIIRQIQKTLEDGRPLDVKAGPVAAQVLKEIQKLKRTSEKERSKEKMT